MDDKKRITIRLPHELAQYIKIRAIMKNRTTNAEITRLIDKLKREEAEKSQLAGTNSSASQ